MKHGSSHQAGQVMVIAAAAMGGLLLLMVLVYHLGEVVVAKIQLANAIDAGAQAGGTVLATALNVVTMLNHAMSAALSTFQLGAFWKAFHMQTAVAQKAPWLAIAVAVETALANGADLAFPMNFVGGSSLPDLQVRRPYFLFFHIPYMRDYGVRTRRFPYGKRYVILGGAKRRPAPQFLNQLRGEKDNGGYLFALSESAVHGSGLWSPSFKATLVKFHPAGLNQAIAWMKHQVKKAKDGKRSAEGTDRKRSAPGN